MTDLTVLEARLARAKAALRNERKRKKEREDHFILSAVRRSGLSLLDLETLLAKSADSVHDNGAVEVDRPFSLADARDPVPGDFSLDGDHQ